MSEEMNGTPLSDVRGSGAGAVSKGAAAELSAEEKVRREVGGLCIEIAGRTVPTPDGERHLFWEEIVHEIGRKVMGWA